MVGPGRAVIPLGTARRRPSGQPAAHGVFPPIKGYVNARVLVSADALPFRPTRGIYVSVTRVDEPRSPEAETLFRWYDRSRIPAMLECRGAAGAWTFASENTFAAPLDLSGDPSPSSTRIVIVYLDEDPLVFVEDLALGQGDAPVGGRRDDCLPPAPSARSFPGSGTGSTAPEA